MTDQESRPTPPTDAAVVDDPYLDELEERWYALMDAAGSDLDIDNPTDLVLARQLLDDWLLVGADQRESHLMLAGGILSFCAGSDVDDSWVVVALEEAEGLCRRHRSPVLVAVLLELGDTLMQRLPRHVLATVDRLGEQLASDRHLADLVETGTESELHCLAGRAWIEVDNIDAARTRFLVAHSLAEREDRPVLEYLISNCSAELELIDDAAAWAVRGMESTEVLGHDVDPDLQESVAEFVARALADRPPTPTRADVYASLQTVFLGRPDWFLPVVGESMYLAAAAEIHEDLGDPTQAWDLIERAVAAQTGDESDGEKAEIAFARARIAVASGQIARGLELIRQASTVVAAGDYGQRNKLAALAAGAMSSFGQGSPAQEELRRIAMARVSNWNDVDKSVEDQRLGFVLGMVDELVDLAGQTLASLDKPNRLAGLTHRWMELAERDREANSASFGTANLLRFAAVTARGAGQADLARTLIGRATEIDRSSDTIAGVSGSAQFATFAHRLALGDVAGLAEDVPGLVNGSGATNDFLHGLMTLIQVVVCHATGAPPREVFAAGCVALQAHARWRAQLPSSIERLAFDARLAGILPIIHEAVAALGDAKVVAEFIEFVRSQAMPEAAPSANVTTVSMQRLLGQLVASEPDSTSVPLVSLDDEVFLGRPGQVRMPWGTVALADFLEPSADMVVDLDVPC